jgi:hypothetical protein
VFLVGGMDEQDPEILMRGQPRGGEVIEQPAKLIRIAQAQLVGWLEGLFHGIQAALWAQHMQARSQLSEMRRRGLPPGPPDSDEPKRPGQYL